MYLTLEEYHLMAKKCLSRFARGYNQTDDAIAYVAYWCMRADQQYDTNIGTRDGFRASYGRFGALKWRRKVSAKKNKKLPSINEFMVEKRLSLSDIATHNEIVDFVKTTDRITDKQRKVFLDYAVRGLTQEDIAKEVDCTPQNVSLIVSKVTSKIKDKFNGGK